MAGRLRAATSGTPINREPTGFPLFYDKRKPRVVTADPWAFLTHLAFKQIGKAKEGLAKAYIEQGREFFEAAQNPRYFSRPLLYYYSFLNVVKAAMLIKGVALPNAARHGISDPKVNSRKRLRFEGQKIHVVNVAHDHSEIFPEFLRMLGHTGRLGRSFRVLDMLQQIPNIHRTFVKVESCDSIFVPVRQFRILHADSHIWARVELGRNDKDVADTLPLLRRRRQFQRTLSPVRPEAADEIWFETRAIRTSSRGIDNTLSVLAKDLRDVGISPIVTAQGLRFYLVDLGPASRVPYLGAALAVIFYLGSITRYKPDVFDKIIVGKHSWVIDEFLATQPMQFLYVLCSELAGVDVVRPYAALL